MKTVFAAALLGGLIAGVGVAQAMPLAPASQGPEIIRVAGGCGPGMHRGPYGGCVRNGVVVVPAPVVVGPVVRACPLGFVWVRGRCRPI
jgi:hypothetical protein